MNTKTQILLWIFVGYVVTFLYILLPEENVYYKFFPFNEMAMSKQSHVYYICERLRWFIFAYVIYEYFWKLVLKSSKEVVDFKIVLWLTAGYGFDYILTANEPITRVMIFNLDVPISYALFMGITLVFIIGKSLWKEYLCQRGHCG